MVDRLERLTNLVLFLREERPRSLREIGDSVPGYPEGGEARRQAFERDKRTLRGGGVDITTVPIAGRDQIGYLIRTEDFYLPELELDGEEQAALNLAVAGVHLGDPSGREALWRLGLPGSAGAQPVAQLPALPALPRLHGALRSHSTLTFSYRGETRHVDPALLRFRGGWWYLVGFDRDKCSPRTFRVDRIEDEPQSGPPGTASLPEDFDPAAELPDAPWKIGEAEPEPVDVLIDAPVAQLVVAEVGESTVVEGRDDGSVLVRLEVTNPDALRSWVLELGEHAEILGPRKLREELAGWLDSILSAPRPDSKARNGRRARRGTGPEADSSKLTQPVRTEGRAADLADQRLYRGRVDAGRRLHRLLAVLTWLARSGRAPVSELAERFGLSPEDLVSDLELAACCGLPPYTPDQLMEIIV
ncbi:MAG: WYL domain-containing protein, partial [Acidimicrobiales bacterium]